MHTTLAQAGWNAVVDSLSAVVEGTGHSWPLLIILGLLALVWADLRLARWISRSFTQSTPTPHPDTDTQPDSQPGTKPQPHAPPKKQHWRNDTDDHSNAA